MRLSRWEQHKLDEETSESIDSHARDRSRAMDQACQRIAADVRATATEWREQGYNLRPAVAAAIWYLKNATKPGQHSYWVERDTAMALKLLEAAMNRGE